MTLKNERMIDMLYKHTGTPEVKVEPYYKKIGGAGEWVYPDDVMVQEVELYLDDFDGVLSAIDVYDNFCALESDGMHTWMDEDGRFYISTRPRTNGKADWPVTFIGNNKHEAIMYFTDAYFTLLEENDMEADDE